MARITIEKDGRVALPENYRQRHGLEGGTELVFEPIEDGLTLRFARPDARRAYVEVTAHCNLNCAMCVRQVWRDAPGEMTWETFQGVIEGLRAFPDLRRLTFGGFGEPLAHPRFAEMLALAAELEVGMTLTTNGLLLDEAMAEKLLAAHLDTVVLTALFCPLADFIVDRVRQAAATVPGVREARVTLLDEPWDPSWMKS